MPETLIPTMGLRFVDRAVPAPEFGENINRTVRVLQQRFERPNGETVWEDVPHIVE